MIPGLVTFHPSSMRLDAEFSDPVTNRTMRLPIVGWATIRHDDAASIEPVLLVPDQGGTVLLRDLQSGTPWDFLRITRPVRGAA